MIKVRVGHAVGFLGRHLKARQGCGWLLGATHGRRLAAVAVGSHPQEAAWPRCVTTYGGGLPWPVVWLLRGRIGRPLACPCSPSFPAAAHCLLSPLVNPFLSCLRTSLLCRSSTTPTASCSAAAKRLAPLSAACAACHGCAIEQQRQASQLTRTVAPTPPPPPGAVSASPREDPPSPSPVCARLAVLSFAANCETQFCGSLCRPGFAPPPVMCPLFIKPPASPPPPPCENRLWTDLLPPARPDRLPCVSGWIAAQHLQQTAAAQTAGLARTWEDDRKTARGGGGRGGGGRGRARRALAWR